jgi:hypothetical protein
MNVYQEHEKTIDEDASLTSEPGAPVAMARQATLSVIETISIAMITESPSCRVPLWSSFQRTERKRIPAVRYQGPVLEHSIRVAAESVFEAAVEAMAAFNQSVLAETLKPALPFLWRMAFPLALAYWSGA